MNPQVLPTTLVELDMENSVTLGFGSDAIVFLSPDGTSVIKKTSPGQPCPLSNQENKVKPDYELMVKHLEGFEPSTATQIPPFRAVSPSILVQPFLSNTGVEIEDIFLYLVSKTECKVSIGDREFFELLKLYPHVQVINNSLTYIKETRSIVTKDHVIYRDVAEFTIQLCRHLLVNVAPDSVHFPVPDIYGRNPLGPVKKITNLNLTNFKFSADGSGTISALCIDPLSYYSLEYNAWVVIINRLISQLDLQIKQIDSGDEAL